MKLLIGYYGDIYYGFGNKYFYLWIADGRKSVLLPKRWRINCFGLFGVNITGLIHNFLNSSKQFIKK